MPVNFGTRSRQNLLHIRSDQGFDTRSRNPDLGMTKLITAASLTFGSGQVSGASGTFASFAAGDMMLVSGDGSNNVNGFYTVTGIDGVNQAYLTLDPPPAAATTTVSIRTP